MLVAKKYQLYFLLILSLIFLDFANGAIIYLVGIDTKVVYVKVLVLLVFALSVLWTQKTLLYALSIVALSVFAFFFHQVDGATVRIVDDVSHFVKLLAPIVSFIFFRQLLSNDNVQARDVNRFVGFFLVAILVLVFFNSIAILSGISIYQYKVGDDVSGGGGLISSGNEYAALLVFFSPILLGWSLRAGKLYFLVVSIILAIAMSVGGMKFAIAGFAAALVWSLYQYRKEIGYVYFSLLTLVIATFSLMLFSTVEQYFSLFISRWAYFYDKFDIVTFLFSGRNVRAEYLFDVIYWDTSFLRFLLGFGWGSDSNIAGLGYGVYEIDILDTAYSYGLLGVLVAMWIWGYFVALSSKIILISNRGLSKDIAFGLLMVFVGSFVTGHIWYSGLLGIYLGLFIAIMLVIQSKVKVKSVGVK
ncbi:O-antigen ligase family protein [Ferrimonas balearica]|uniref:O-antigen ligase family protein n=1 Tax=Ferrimonas balearica TaxID=44012 RepID=UPI001C992FBA|nr:O-antigen ligase family protein [Ferrimonas balearica]MBY5990773.1 O-antigen ligase family protein [Ferrimonas balearica]